MIRNVAPYLNETFSKTEFRQFLEFHEEGRLQWQATITEAQRLQKMLDKCSQERSDLETKLFHARRLLEMESKARRTVEMERDALELKLSQVCDFLRTDGHISDEARNKFAYLDKNARKRKSKVNKYAEAIVTNEPNSTGSFLSNLSVTQSEEDFLEIQKPFKKHRPSVTGCNDSYTEARSSRCARRSAANEQRNTQSKLFTQMHIESTKLN